MSYTQPRKRSKIRAALGLRAYSLLKYLHWLLHYPSFSALISHDDLPHVVFAHRTPLLRKLKDVDIAYQHNKIHNLKIAIRKIDGLILKPGKIFSYWKLIGSPDEAKGYKEGIELYYGKFRPGVGGGLCQLSNLLYWMFLHSPLMVTERHRHSYDVFPDVNRKLPFGSGATCYYPFMDLEVVNGTGQDFQIRVRVTDEYLEGEIRSSQMVDLRYEVKEINHCFKPEFWGGYSRHNKIVRNTYKEGVPVASELIAENNALCMYAPFLERPDI